MRVSSRESVTQEEEKVKEGSDAPFKPRSSTPIAFWSWNLFGFLRATVFKVGANSDGSVEERAFRPALRITYNWASAPVFAMDFSRTFFVTTTTYGNARLKPRSSTIVCAPVRQSNRLLARMGTQSAGKFFCKLEERAFRPALGLISPPPPPSSAPSSRAQRDARRADRFCRTYTGR